MTTWNCERCSFLMRECMDCKMERLERENADYQRAFKTAEALLATQESLVERRTKERNAALEEAQQQLALIAHERDYLHGESTLLEKQRNEARQTARRSYRCAQHLAIMHRRENRVMEGAEGELEAIRREAGEWLTRAEAIDE